MVRLTKAQIKDRDEIEAWLEDKPFARLARDKPKVPDLTMDDVIEKYVPQFVSDGAKFHTPLEMAFHLHDNFSFVWSPGTPTRILDPCAGIGNLLYPMKEMADIYLIDAFDADEESAVIGNRLYPLIHWYHQIPFEFVNALHNRYDLVICNPPVNSTWAMMPGEVMSNGRAKKSEHIFLELAIRALKTNGDGLGVFIAPYNFFDRMPKSFKAWVAKHITEPVDMGELPGKFRFTGMSVHGWTFHRTEKPIQRIDNSQFPNMTFYDELPAEIDSTESKVNLNDNIHKPDEPSVQTQADGESNGLSVHIADEKVFDGLEYLSAHPRANDDIKETIRFLRQSKYNETAHWVLHNKVTYGEGYWNGFEFEGQVVTLDS